MSTRALRPLLLLPLLVCLACPVLAQTQALAPENETWFDPRKYTVGQFVKDGEAGDHEAQGLALLWAFGFQAGLDPAQIKPVDDHAVRGLMYRLMALGEERPQLDFLEAVRQALRLEAEMKKPQPAPNPAEPETKR